VIGATRRDRSLANSDPTQIVEEIHGLVGPLLAGLGDGPQVVAIGVSVPGAVRAEDGYLHHAPNLGWRDVRWGTSSASASAT